MKVTRDNSILDASPLVIMDGMLPHRVVLRKLEDSYEPFVTHFETMTLSHEDYNTWVHESFFEGHYFSTLDKAEKDFNERRHNFAR